MLSRYEKSLPGLSTYFRELALWNRRVNLTGLRTPEKMVSKHLGDTVVLEQWLPEQVHFVLDIGTGAGIPGLILKILRPGLDCWLLDARRKRVSFLQAVIAELGMDGVHAVHGRAGEGTGLLFPGAPARFDMVTGQAVGSVIDLAKMAEEFIRAGGLVVSMKGPAGTAELEEARPALEDLGWKAGTVATETPLERQKRLLVIMKRAEF